MLGTIRLLDQPLTLVSYRVVDPQTLIVSGFGTTRAWTHLTGVAETETTITINVNSLEYTGFLPHSDAADQIDIKVGLNAVIGSRQVIDGSTGQPTPTFVTD